MKIELDLPDWVNDESAIRIFKGTELVAKKFQDELWEIKIVRCNFCGECCTIKGPGWKEDTIQAREDGYCIERIPKPNESGKFLCGLGEGRPFHCSAYATWPENNDKCCIRWIKIRS